MSNIIGQLNDSGEWYTPHWIIDLIKEVLGEIDLDPASSPEANKYIKARRIYTIKDDGLKKPWFGKVFVNPPYVGFTNRWSKKFLEGVDNSEIEAAILLVNANFGYDWFTKLLYNPFTVCTLPKDRLYFIPADGQKADKARRQTAIFYYGTNPIGFEETFRPYGKIIY